MSLARAACCMLWVTIAIVNLLFSSLDQVLDRQGRDRVERRAGLVHQQHLGLDRDRAGDAEPLLLAAGEARAGLVEPVLDLVPEVGAAQRALDDLVLLGLLHPARVEVEPGGDVLVDRHRRERVGRLEDHADQAADLDRVDPVRVDVLAVERDLALDAGARRSARACG